MRPMSRLVPEAANPVNGSAAGRAVKDQPSQLPFEIGLHVQQLQDAASSFGG